MVMTSDRVMKKRCQMWVLILEVVLVVLVDCLSGGMVRQLNA